jgi:hypothetical protein
MFSFVPALMRAILFARTAGANEIAKAYLFFQNGAEPKRSGKGLQSLCLVVRFHPAPPLSTTARLHHDDPLAGTGDSSLDALLYFPVLLSCESLLVD